MGGDQLVPALGGRELEDRCGDAVREVQKEIYAGLMPEVAPFDGARELMTALGERGHRVVLASSARPEEVDHYLDLLGARDLVHGWTTAADVDETKPNPDLVHAALERAGGGEAAMIGDTAWDCEAAHRAGIGIVLAVLTGGISEAELTAAGASAVYESVGDLARRLGASPLGAR